MKSIPHTCNTSTGMFEHNVRLEDHFDLRGIVGKTLTYEVINEDTKSLRCKKWKIQVSPKPLVKIELNKLLASKITISVHAQKWRIVRLKTMRCQLNEEIWLYQNHILGEIFPWSRSDDSPNFLRVVKFCNNCTYSFLHYLISCIILYFQ